MQEGHSPAPPASAVSSAEVTVGVRCGQDGPDVSSLPRMLPSTSSCRGDRNHTLSVIHEESTDLITPTGTSAMHDADGSSQVDRARRSDRESSQEPSASTARQMLPWAHNPPPVDARLGTLVQDHSDEPTALTRQLPFGRMESPAIAAEELRPPSGRRPHEHPVSNHPSGSGLQTGTAPPSYYKDSTCGAGYPPPVRATALSTAAVPCTSDSFREGAAPQAAPPDTTALTRQLPSAEWNRLL